MVEIKYKGILHERTEDAPFVSALIVAPTCKLKCKGCFNVELKKQPNLKATAKEIVDEVKSNPFNEGITLGGLEWSESPLELLELVRVASENGLKVMIYTGCDNLQMFHARLGEACAKECGEKINYKDDFDYLLYIYIGLQVLDEYIKDSYYIKVGKYNENELVNDRVHFGVKLATKNQCIFKIEKMKE